jgi:uridine kinase
LTSKGRVGIFGVDGSGKTEVVQQYIQQVGKNYSVTMPHHTIRLWTSDRVGYQ